VFARDDNRTDTGFEQENRRMKTDKLIRQLPALTLGLAILAAATAAVVGTNKDDKPEGRRAPPAGVVVDERPLERDGKFVTSFASVVKKVTPSVVKVSTAAEVKQTALPEFPGFDSPWFRRFFGDEFDGQGRSRRYRAPRQHGLGSGVIVTKDGYLLTNNHLVENADEVKVTLPDGREFDAKVVGKDPKTDVAVLKIDARDLPFLEMADSDKIEVGDLALAVGNPYGIGQTVTMGMVSATGRASLGLDYEDFIQTDAAINPGNSGGALVDAQGRLIGINTAILSRSGGNQGIGFAIPSNLARDVMSALIKDGKVTRGYLGVMIQDVTPALAKEFKLDDRNGALVGDVVPKGPADKAGLKSGDVIVEFDGKPVRDSRHLKLQVARIAPGETASVKVLRDGSAKTLEVTVRELPSEPNLARADQPGENTEALKGVTVADLDRQARRQFDIPEHVTGALVADVEPDSSAGEAGLRPGDVLLEINRQPVRSAEDAVRLSEKPKGKTTLVRVWRDGGSRYVVVDERRG
jgi:serine protease Do